MPPLVALLMTVVFIVLLFRRDFGERPKVTPALWLPVCWLLLIGSRPVSQWLGLCGFPVGASSLEDGSPVDAMVYLVLIAAGMAVLQRRQMRLGEVIRDNRWLAAFLVYCFFSILWSDDPFVSFKRWIKILGHPIMTLVLITEPDPEEAFVRLMKRCAYVLVPASILLIKYFPQWGRGFEVWSGFAHDTGVTNDKNALGCDCLIFGCFFFWYLLQVWQRERSVDRRHELLLCVLFLGLTGWLLKAAQSSTSTVSLLAAMATVLFLGLPFINHRLLGAYVAAAIVVVLLAQAAFGIFAQGIQLLGKDPTLTDRTLLWHELMQFKINPVIGTGYEDFWMGPRLEQLWRAHWWHPIEAHNGYLETYLNLGLIGVGLMLGLIYSAFRKGNVMLLKHLEFARFRLGFLAAFVLYNWTEAAFKALHPVWFIFYLIAMDLPRPQPLEQAELSATDAADDRVAGPYGEKIWQN